jgi:hypothetical protein
MENTKEKLLKELTRLVELSGDDELLGNEIVANMSNYIETAFDNFNRMDMLEDEIRHLKAMLKDNGKNFNQPTQCEQAAVMPSLPTDEDIMKWSKEFNESDIEAQAQFRVMAKFMRLCMKGNRA